MKLLLTTALTACLLLLISISSDCYISLPQNPGDIREYKEWLGIYLEGKKIGYAFNGVEKTAGGYTITEETDTTLTVMGTSQKVRSVTLSEYDESLGLKSFRFSMTAGGVGTNINGVVDGKVLRLSIDTMGNIQKHEIKLKESPHLSGDIQPYLIMQGLEAGKKFKLPFFNPATMSLESMDITVEAVEDMKLGSRLVPVYKVRQEFAGISARFWISPETGAVKGDGPMGMTYTRETKEQAMRVPAGGYQSVDIIALTSIKAGGKAVREARAVRYLKASFSGADISGLDIAGGRQGYKDGIITITKEDPDNARPVKLPVPDATLSRHLAPEPFIQSDDTRIISKAKEITGGDADAQAAARRICDWVYSTMQKKTSAGIPNAVEVLSNLSGDCNEHTALYTALARAAGIPARMNAGIVMMDGRFYYHAWPEVYIGNWVSVDPTFGQFPADATHIRLVQGGLDRYVDVLRLVGNLKVEVLEYK